MKLAADIDEALNLEVRAVQYRPDERVVVIEFGVSSDNNSGLCLTAFRLLGRSYDDAYDQQSQTDHPAADSAHYIVPGHVILPVRCLRNPFQELRNAP